MRAKNNKPAEIRIGTSGWNYRHWRGVFYPEGLPTKRWFEFYKDYFDTVEINNTFYHLPTAEVFCAWARQAPAGFLYAAKANRYLTHMKKLRDPAEPLELFLDRVRRLKDHLGPILYQLPPHWRCDVARLADFIQHLPADLRHVFEFRDTSWCHEEVKALLTKTGMNYCIHDSRRFDCPAWVTGPLVYIRFHGPRDQRRNGCYNRAHLFGWAEKIRQFHQSGRDVFVYFNNDTCGHAVTNARELQRMLHVEPPVAAERGTLPLFRATPGPRE
jgi:uncharacterized protein YecE (DUF72 family)